MQGLEGCRQSRTEETGESEESEVERARPAHECRPYTPQCPVTDKWLSNDLRLTGLEVKMKKPSLKTEPRQKVENVMGSE